MKKILLTISAGLILGLSALPVQAQKHQKTPKWVSEKGYWVVQSNIHTPDSTIIYFYTNDNKLVYKEKVDGESLNVEQTKTKMRLKTVLEQLVTAWAKDSVIRDDQQLLAVRQEARKSH